MACIELAGECDDSGMACIEIIDENENIQEIVYDAQEPEIDIEYENPFDPNFTIDFGHYALAAKMLVAPAVHPQTQLDNANFIIDSGSGHQCGITSCPIDIYPKKFVKIGLTSSGGLPFWPRRTASSVPTAEFRSRPTT